MNQNELCNIQCKNNKKLKLSNVIQSFIKYKDSQYTNKEDDSFTSALLYDIDSIRNQCHALKDAFPKSCNHSFAIKACPVTEVLKIIKETDFMGVEAASMGELQQALKVGFSLDRIVYDSPTKTKSELKEALHQGVYINADNFQELERINLLINQYPSKSKIGLRINTQVGGGSIACLSTATLHSKFGVAITNHRNEIIQAFEKFPFLSALHLHCGSQGMAIDTMIKGIQTILELANEINAKFKKPLVQIIDIGGGLPVDYLNNQTYQENGQKFYDYSKRIYTDCPDLFTSFKVVTEFGRALVCKSAVAISKVEYTKTAGDRHIALQHLGGDLLLRAIYQPTVWIHQIIICDTKGIPKEEQSMYNEKKDQWELWDIGGPLCFSGDLLIREAKLPPICQEDYIVVNDVGAYTLSMWSRYNSRPTPPVYGYCNVNDEDIVWQEIKKKECIENIIKFWD